MSPQYSMFQEVSGNVNWSRESQMIDSTRAASIANNFVNSPSLDKGMTEPKLEGIELSQDKRYWLVAVRFRSDQHVDGSTSFLHKIVKIDANDGTVVSMKDMIT
jgi:hypothetical protein